MSRKKDLKATDILRRISLSIGAVLIAFASGTYYDVDIAAKHFGYNNLITWPILISAALLGVVFAYLGWNVRFVS
jgi:hypothetical protein